MKLKVCGMKYPENTREVIRHSPDFMGFIFYPRSPRYMAETLEPEFVRDIPAPIKKVGVFVNESLQVIAEHVGAYGLDLVQLHGDESPGFCEKIRKTGAGVIKVFHVDEEMDWESLKVYQPFTDFFLFDTKSKHYGGTGKSFNWEILKDYDLETPYFLSGGISLENVGNIKTALPNLPVALDVNSRFETKPGFKDTALLKKLTGKLAQDFPPKKA